MVGRIAAVLLVLVSFFALPGAAEEGMPDLQAPLDEFYAAIPETVRDGLPEAMFDASMPDADAVREAGSLSAWLDRVRASLADALPSSGRLLGQLCLCLLFAAIFGVICTAFDGGRVGETAQLLGRLCTAWLLFDAQLHQLEVIGACLRQMRLILGAMLPVLAAILASGGNAGTASAGCGSLLLFLTLGENLCTGIIFPLIAASTGLAAVGWLPDGNRLRGIAVCLKRITIWGLGLFGAVFSAVLAFQTILAAGADSVAARTVKFAVSSAVPVIGGVVGETVRTVASGLSYLKDTVGLMGILVLALLALPPLVGLLLHRAAVILGGAVADLLGCSGEKKLFDEFAGVGGTLLALLCVALLCFIFALVLFVRVTLAVGQ